jgi:hypothetical protein
MVLSKFLDEYKTFTLRGQNNKREKLRATAKLTFEKMLYRSPTVIDIQVTDVDEVLITENTKTVMAVVNNITDNDQTSLDEKEIYFPVDTNVDIGCYCFFDNCYWLIIFKEHHEMGAYLHFVARRCNQIINYAYNGIVYPIPVSILNLTMYSDGVNQTRYVDIGDAKRHIFIGSNPITRTFDTGTRVMLTRKTVFRVTHINDFEFNGRYSGADGLIKALTQQTVRILEDDCENKIAYNIVGEKNVEEDDNVMGLDYIYLGEENEYNVDTDKEIEFILDTDYSNTSIIKQENNKCIIKQSSNIESIGDNIMLIARDKKTKETIDMFVITVRGV